MTDHFSHELAAKIFHNFDIDINSDHEEEISEQVEPVDQEPIMTVVFKKYNEDEKTMDHVQAMISFGLMRGFGGKKAWESIYSKTHEGARKMLQTAVDFLLGKQNRWDTMVVPRLMQSFPKLTWDLHCQLFIQGQYEKAENGTVYNGDLPKCLRYSGSPGVMGPDVWDTYRNDYCSFVLALGRLWKSEQTSEEITKFAVMNYECLAIEPGDRITMAMVKEAEAQIEEAEKNREAKNKELQDFMNEMMNFNFDALNLRERFKMFAEIFDDDNEEDEETKNKKQVDDEEEEPADIEADKENGNGEEGSL